VRTSFFVSLSRDVDLIVTRKRDPTSSFFNALKACCTSSLKKDEVGENVTITARPRSPHELSLEAHRSWLLSSSSMDFSSGGRDRYHSLSFKESDTMAHT